MGYIVDGHKVVGTLRQVAVYRDASRVPTGVTKPNVIGDPDYIPPFDSDDCTTTTTSTTTTSTTTTTTLAPIPCDSPTAYAGGQSYPTTQDVILGAGLGIVTLTIDAFSIPDKFIVTFDGVDVINTGYRGDTSQQSGLDAALAALGRPPETIAGIGTGTFTFNKTTATTIATVKVFAPMSGTSWNFTLSCPV